MARLNVLRPFEDARAVGIYDVSAHGNTIAVAAVFESSAGNKRIRPAPALMLFNFQGQFLSAFALKDAILRLAFDEGSNIWALSDAGNGSTTADPRILECPGWQCRIRPLH